MKQKHTQQKSATRGHIKAKMRILGSKTVYNGNGPYVKPKAKKRTTFTEELRNSKGYSNHLKQKYGN